MEGAWNNHKHKTYHMVAYDGLSDAGKRAELFRGESYYDGLERFHKAQKTFKDG